MLQIKRTLNTGIIQNKNSKKLKNKKNSKKINFKFFDFGKVLQPAPGTRGPAGVLLSRFVTGETKGGVAFSRDPLVAGGQPRLMGVMTRD